MADTKENIKCPACGNLMKKVCINDKYYIDICADGCGGMWFDNRELEKMTSGDSDFSQITQAYNSSKFVEVDKTEVRKCPICRTKMVKHQPAPNLAVNIDECYTCGGKFLDKGELESIINNKDNDVNSLIEFLENNKKSRANISNDQFKKLLIDLKKTK